MNEHKENLEKELRFLKESLEAGVISGDEYRKGKQRIEKNLNEIEEAERIDIKELEEKPEIMPEKTGVMEGLKEEPEEEADVKIEINHDDGGKPKEPFQKPERGIEERTKEKKEPKAKEEFFVINKRMLFAVGIIAVITIAYFFLRPPRGDDERIEITVPGEDVFEPVCSSYDDCRKTGKVGVCKNPGTEEAECLFEDPVEVRLTIINDETCESCDTSRMLDILNQLFVDVRVTEVSYKDSEKAISDLGIRALPAYVFDSSVAEAIRFEEFERALVKIGDSYVMLPTASGANYFFMREETKNTLELFSLEADTEKISNNIAEVLELFGDNIKYSESIVSKKGEEKLKKEFAITTYPTLVVNNQLKFTGIQPAETIKQKFCELNALDGCERTLSEDLKQ